MRLLVRHAPPFRRWHRMLGEALATDGHEVGFEATGRTVEPWLTRLERAIYRLSPDWMAHEAAPALPSWSPDATLVLSGDRPAGGLSAALLVDGGRGEAALVAAARRGRAPLIVVRGGPAAEDRTLAAGRPAIEDPLVASRALDGLTRRLVPLLREAVARLAGSRDDEPATFDPAAPVATPSPPAFLARSLAAKAARRLGPRRGRPDHWRLALRRDGEAGLTTTADDPARFRADPFLFEHEGRTLVFHEELPYASGKGVIAALEPGHDSVVVLETPTHLSYPLVLRHAGDVWMLPEAAASGVLRLWRAVDIPTRWEAGPVLIDAPLADATPILHEGKWWLFATRCDGGSTWDALDLWHAHDLLGPWTRHKHNPVLIDAGAARPAGMMWHEDGVLMRPAQDCRAGYGDAVVVCRVDRLDEGGYAQTIVRRLDPPAGAQGLHTLNRLDDLEVVDLKVPHPR